MDYSPWGRKEFDTTEHTHNLTYNTSVTALLLLLAGVTRLFCNWFALSTHSSAICSVSKVYFGGLGSSAAWPWN